ncbi:Forkhead box protein N3 [Lemmus lemmus]
MAIEDSPTKRLPVKDIYNWILEHFPYFANAPTGWKNSVRHNLSLNKCFKKVDKERSQVCCLVVGWNWIYFVILTSEFFGIKNGCIVTMLK